MNARERCWSEPNRSAQRNYSGCTEPFASAARRRVVLTRSVRTEHEATMGCEGSQRGAREQETSTAPWRAWLVENSHATVAICLTQAAWSNPMDDWNPETERRKLESVHAGPYELRAGDRVRLRPRGRADILDIALAGMIATVESVEQHFDDRVYLAVTVDEDPGKDLGQLRQPGHRFFFAPQEVEPLSEGEQ